MEGSSELVKDMWKVGPDAPNVRGLGDPKNPCLISIVGTGASMNGMNPMLEDLAALGLYVINFNPRDSCGTGPFEAIKQKVETDEATKDKDLAQEMGKLFGETGLKLDVDFFAPYNWYDMAEDVKAVMEVNDIARASIIGFSTGGTIAQAVMVKLSDRLNCAIIGSSGFDMDGMAAGDAKPHENTEENKAALAEMAAVTPESTLEERLAKIMPGWMSMFEVTRARGDPWEGKIKHMIADDYKNKWFDTYGGTNPFPMLAWASFAKTSAEHHHPALSANTVPCQILAGKVDPIVAFDQSVKLFAHLKQGAEGRGLRAAEDRELDGGAASVSAMLDDAGVEVLQFIAHEGGHILGPKTVRTKLIMAIADFVKQHSQEK